MESSESKGNNKGRVGLRRDEDRHGVGSGGSSWTGNDDEVEMDHGKGEIPFGSAALGWRMVRQPKLASTETRLTGNDAAAERDTWAGGNKVL